MTTPIDVSRFGTLNVLQPRAAFNVLASPTLHRAAVTAGCHFCVTDYVRYECLDKRRRARPHEEELQKRLRREQMRGAVPSFPLELGDLLELASLERRRSLSRAELSSIAFARKTSQAVFADGRNIASLTKIVPNAPPVQSTPHLFGWLVYSSHLSDGEKATVIAEHTAARRPLAGELEEAYLEALRCRLIASASGTHEIKPGTPSQNTG